MINTLFILSVDGELEVSKPEAKSIPAYKALFDRDKGSIGDSDGRKKRIACAEIKYIYLVYDVRSIYYNLPLNEKKSKARANVGLPDNWKEDEVLEIAKEQYLADFQLTGAGKAYFVAERGYHSLASDCALIQDTIVELKALLISRVKTLESNKKLGAVELQTVVEETNNVMSEIVKLQDNLMKNIEKFDKIGQTVKQLAAKFAEEGGNLRTPVGGGELGNREE